MRADKRPQPCDVTVYSDKGSLALRFPKRHNPLGEQLDGKPLNGKQKCLGIGKYGYKDNPEDWKRATQLAIALEADLDHPEWEKLFDLTLAKYGLGGGKYAKLADVLQLPGTVQAKPEITVGEMWEAYLEWKKTVIEESTFLRTYKTFTYALKGMQWESKLSKLFDNNSSVYEIPLDSQDLIERVAQIKLNPKSKKGFLSAMNEAFLHSQSLGYTKLTINPFHGLWDKTKPSVNEQYQPTVNSDGELLEWWQVVDSEHEDSLETDRRSFTTDERNTIIQAFYASEKKAERHAAPLIEFLFLTGCRPGEAFALRWQDVMFEFDVIRFSKSYSSATKKVKKTKTGEIRTFKLYPRLTELLQRLHPSNAEKTDLVFKTLQGKPFNSFNHKTVWNCNSSGGYSYLGLVSRLANEGEISGYLSPYHTRHTYITLTAHANKHDNNALLYIATSCGNSVDVILRHYLGVSEENKIIQV